MEIPRIPDLHNKAVAKAHQNHAGLVRKLAEQQRVVETAAAAHQGALAADRDALAKAMREGRPEPKPRAANAQEAMVQAKRRHEALEQAVAEDAQAFAGLIETNLATLKQETGKRVQGARAKFLSALEAVEATHGELAVEEATAGWLNHWPDGKGNVGQRFVTDLPRKRNDEPLTTEEVFAALHKRGLPPEPRRPAGALRITEQGMINPSREPLIETLIGPEAA
jgi:hypothetical protein